MATAGATAMEMAGAMAMVEVTAMATAGAMVEVTAIDRLFPSGATSALPIIGALACGLLFRRSMPQSRGARLQAKLNGPQLTLSDHESLPDDALQIVGSGEKEDGPREAAETRGARSETKRVPLRNRRTRPVDLKYRALERA